MLRSSPHARLHAGEGVLEGLACCPGLLRVRPTGIFLIRCGGTMTATLAIVMGPAVSHTSLGALLCGPCRALHAGQRVPA